MKHSFRRLFIIYSAFYLLIISGIVGLAGYYLFQSQRQEVLESITKAKYNVHERLEKEVSQLEDSLNVLKVSFDIFAFGVSTKSLDHYSKIIAQLIHQRDVQYNAYFALEPEWALKYFNRPAYILTTHRDPRYYGTAEFYDRDTFRKTIYTDPVYQSDISEVWYHTAKASTAMVITEPYYDKTYMQQWLITAGLGIYENGVFQGMVGIDVLVDELTKKIGRYTLGKTGGILWIDKRNNQILSQSSQALDKFIGPSNRFGSPALRSKTEREVWQSVLNSGASVTEVLGANGSRYVVSSLQVEGTPWKVVVYQDYWEAFAPMFEKFYRICLVAVLALLLLGQLAIHVQSSIANPMEKLIESIKVAIRSARKSQSVHHRETISASGYKELHRVSKLFNLLLRVIDKNSSKQITAIELERVKALHQAKMASLGQMASGIAHEINNPLSILNNRLVKAEGFLRRDPPDVEAAVSTVRSIEQIVFRIAKIVRGLRQFSREASKDPFEFKPVREIIEETLDLCSQRFQAHGIQVYTQELDEDVIIECQTVQISQVLLNLLNNSFDAVASMSEKWVRIEVQELENDVLIRVTDSGPGIPEDLRDRIMDPFFTTKEVGKGTGLGLSLSRGIIEYHQGQLYLDPDSKHTCFVIRLPKFRERKLTGKESKALH